MAIHYGNFIVDGILGTGNEASGGYIFPSTIGTSGQSFIVTSEGTIEFGDYDLSNYTLLSTTASISGDLQNQIDSITVPTSATFLSDYDARYVNESDLTVTLGNYTLLSTTSSISGALEAAKQDNITLLAGSNVTIIESPTDTWTISASISGGIEYVSAPAYPTDAGTQGQRAYSSNYVYECIATNTWVRYAAATSWGEVVQS
jgi:hypothetical protein